MLIELPRVFSLLEGRHIAPRLALFIAEVGSTAHGINVGEQDDLDLTVVRIDPLHELVNGPESRQSMMVRSQPEGHRSGPGDIDLQVYALRKYIGLVLNGNPSILAALHSPKNWHGPYSRLVDWEWWRDNTASKRAGDAFLGYMRQQKERWVGTRGQKNVSRPELVALYGFDTKYAAHIIRLGSQGVEYMRTGRLTMPLPESLARRIRALRTGKYTETEALEWANDIEVDLAVAIQKSGLPDKPYCLDGFDYHLTHLYRSIYEAMEGDGF